MYKIDDDVSDSGYTSWQVLGTKREFPLICTCDDKQDAELVVEALKTLHQLNKGFFS
jgi:hypothetical protein